VRERKPKTQRSLGNDEEGREKTTVTIEKDGLKKKERKRKDTIDLLLFLSLFYPCSRICDTERI